jgi:hypothetical protein
VTPTAAPPVALSGTIATGSFSSPDGSTTGTATVTAEGGQFFVNLNGFHSSRPGTLGLSFSPWPASTKCLVDQNSASFGDLSAAPDQPNLPLGTWEGNPSIFHTLVVYTAPASGLDAHGCVLSPVAFAPMTWTVPDTRPSLRPHDTGARGGAHGTITGTAAAPLTYTVAAGDYENGIASRFGISLDDLRFLNPWHSTQPQAGQKLNLSKALRGTNTITPPPSS